VKVGKKKYINYVSYVINTQEMSDAQLQEEMYFLKTKLRICEQTLRLRRNNEQIIQGAAGHDSVASE
jgi:hypothetical protein